MSSLRYLLAAFANANVEVNVDDTNDTAHLDSVLIKIVEDYKSGSISKLEYYNSLSVRHNRISIALHDEYLGFLKEKDDLLKNTPIWSSIRYLLFAVQFATILAAIFVYFLIYRSISSRVR